MTPQRVSRITKEHIGKLFKKEEYHDWKLILFVGDKCILSRNDNGDEYAVSIDSNDSNGWLIRDPQEKEKLPSQRINEWLDTERYSPVEKWHINNCSEKAIVKIVEILDELAQQKKESK